MIRGIEKPLQHGVLIESTMSAGSSAMPLMPAFVRRKKGAGTIARLLAGYGELEFLLAYCLSGPLAIQTKAHYRHNKHQHRNKCEKLALKLLFAERGESKRFDLAKSRMHSAYASAGLKAEYVQTMGAFKKCLEFRNLFSHCLWGQSKRRGLSFCNLEETAKKSGPLKFKMRHATQKQLSDLEDYFWLTLQWLDYLQSEFKLRSGLIRNHPHAIPRKIPAMKQYMEMFRPIRH